MFRLLLYDSSVAAKYSQEFKMYVLLLCNFHVFQSHPVGRTEHFGEPFLAPGPYV